MAFSITRLDIQVLLLSLSILFIARIAGIVRRSLHTTRLRGPPATSWLFGVSRDVFTGDSATLVEKWTSEYGDVLQVPAVLGGRRTVLADAKAIQHFFSRETYGYVQTNFARIAIERLVGRGLLYAEGEDHRRQRKALTPAFSNAAIRSVTPVFYDSAYKLKDAWDATIESSSGEALIDVQSWMNHVSLDSIGIAGFAHDFGSLRGQKSAVADVFDSFTTLKPRSKFATFIPLLAPVLPLLLSLPTKRSKLNSEFARTTSDIAHELLERSREEKEAEGRGKGTGDASRSIIGALIRAESAGNELSLSQEEILAQMRVLILAGYETTSVSLTWALIELSKNPEIQRKLRQELLDRFPSTDIPYDVFQSPDTLPYLDGVTREILRLHPPLGEVSRQAADDDVIPLSSPIVLPNGEKTTSVHIAKGEVVSVAIGCMNKSEAIWGADAKVFKPERWMIGEDEKKEISDDGLGERVKEIQGYHHLLTFVDGPRMCLGRGFAVAEFKAVLSVLIKNYTFELRDGVDSKIEILRSILPRPKLVGEDGARVMMRVRRVEH